VLPDSQLLNERTGGLASCGCPKGPSENKACGCPKGPSENKACGWGLF